MDIFKITQKSVQNCTKIFRLLWMKISMSSRTNSQATVFKKRPVLLTKDTVHYNPAENHDADVQLRQPSTSQLCTPAAAGGLVLHSSPSPLLLLLLQQAQQPLPGSYPEQEKGTMPCSSSLDLWREFMHRKVTPNYP